MMAEPFKAPAPIVGERHDVYLGRLAHAFEQWVNIRLPAAPCAAHDTRPLVEIEITEEMMKAAGDVFLVKMGDTWPEWRDPPAWLREILQVALQCCRTPPAS